MMRLPRNTENSSFTLIELMVATAIILVVIVGSIIVYVNCIILNESNANLVTAAGDLQVVLEDIKALSYNDIDSYASPVFSNLINESITLQRSDITANLKEVTVSVSWQERQRTKGFQLSTRIAR